MEATNARKMRLKLLPDTCVGSTTFNTRIRGGLFPVAVADRACILLDALQLNTSPERLDAMKAAIYLAGALVVPYDDRPPMTDVTQAFEPLTAVGVLRLNGYAWDTTFSYYRALAADTDDWKVARAVLTLAELEATATLGASNRKHRKVYGDARHFVLPLVVTVPEVGPTLQVALESALKAGQSLESPQTS